MALPELYQALLPFNSHWSEGRASRLVRKHQASRRSLRHIRDRIDDLPFEVLVGPRQVGKTTLVGNLIDDLLEQGVPADTILFVPCDLPSVNLETHGQVGPLIELFQQRILKRPLDGLERPAYLFLDEVHELDDWSRQLKALYDTYHPWLRVFATGSSSVSLLNPPSADLPGRVRASQIYPLKWNEAVEALVPGLSSKEDAAYGKGRAVRETLRASATKEGQAKLKQALDTLHGSLLVHKPALLSVFDRYLVRGGFPASLLAETDEEASLFLEQTLDLTVSKDLVRHPRVRKVHAFATFLAQMARQHGGPFVAHRVAETIGVDRSSVTQWKEIAEELFLVQQLPPLNLHFNPLPAKKDKAYIVDPGLRAFLSTERTLEHLESSGKIGHVVEGIVHDHVRRLQYNLFTRRTNRLGFLTNPEVDLIAEIPEGWLGIEVKYTERPEVAVRQMERMTFDQANVQRIVLTRDTYDVRGDVWVLPAWLFCFVC